MTDEAPATRGIRRIEVATAILLSVAGLVSAWASFQAALWGGQQADHYAEANAKTTEATRLSIVEGQMVGTDTLLFTAWLEAAADGDEQRMTFFRRRFSPEMRVVFDKWRATTPADLRTGRPDPNSPVGLPRPIHPEGIEARRLQTEAIATFAQGDKDNAIGDRFVAATVVLSTVLFLGGISPLLHNLKVRMALLVLAALIGGAAIVYILSLPAAGL